MPTQKLLNSLETNCHWIPSQLLVVGVSGGADSNALLHALKHIGAQVLVGHFNHHLRANASRDAEFVEAVCRKLGLLFELGQADVKTLAQEWGIGVEEAARRARYEFLFNLAHQHNAQAVVTAHHADDQIETILMHFLRGTGLDGLTGMPYRGVIKSFDTQIPIIRPLLEVSKTDILRYCVEQGLNYMEDETNLQNEAFRNRLRNELIPILETYNPNFRSVILRNAAAIQGDQRLLVELEQKAFHNCLDTHNEHGMLLKRSPFLGFSKALQSRVIRRALKLVVPDQRDFGFEMLQATLEAIEAGQTYLPLTDKLALWCVGEQMQILRAKEGPILTAFPQLVSLSTENWGPKANFQLAEGWVLHREMVDRMQYEDQEEMIKHDPMHAWIHISKPKRTLIVRHPSVGEAFAPLGMSKGRQKLSDLFINQKIPQPARPNWPVVTVGDTIVWVVGLRLGHDYRLIDDNTPVLHLWAERATR